MQWSIRESTIAVFTSLGLKTSIWSQARSLTSNISKTVKLLTLTLSNSNSSLLLKSQLKTLGQECSRIKFIPLEGTLWSISVSLWCNNITFPQDFGWFWPFCCHFPLKPFASHCKIREELLCSNKKVQIDMHGTEISWNTHICLMGRSLSL